MSCPPLSSSPSDRRGQSPHRLTSDSRLQPSTVNLFFRLSTPRRAPHRCELQGHHIRLTGTILGRCNARVLTRSKLEVATSRSSVCGATNISPCCCCKNKLPDPWVAAASPKHNRKRSASACRSQLFRVPWRTMLLWDATPHLQFSISSQQLHIYDGGRYKMLQGGGCVRYFDVGDEE
jgi:hypothetical protein